MSVLIVLGLNGKTFDLVMNDSLCCAEGSCGSCHISAIQLQSVNNEFSFIGVDESLKIRALFRQNGGSVS
jgi:hypothetical protein